jgi:hypothetical protein
MFRNPDLIAPLTPRGAAQPLAPIDLTSDDLRIPIGIAALAVAVGADGLLVPSAAWARYADDLPTIEIDPPLIRPAADRGTSSFSRTKVWTEKPLRRYIQGPHGWYRARV